MFSWNKTQGQTRVQRLKAVLGMQRCRDVTKIFRARGKNQVWLPPPPPKKKTHHQHNKMNRQPQLFIVPYLWIKVYI